MFQLQPPSLLEGETTMLSYQAFAISGKLGFLCYTILDYFARPSRVYLFCPGYLFILRLFPWAVVNSNLIH